MPNLKTLIISDCCNLVDSDITIVNKLKNLRNFQCGFTQIEALAVVNIVKCHRSLEHLDCTGISFSRVAINKLFDNNMFSLKSVVFSSNGDLNSNELNDIALAHPNVVFRFM